ncbi:MAG: SDR family NAD(P)-dependent oxidoreductase [Candidatus Lokiarchaeota archaeon]|nr:SDR family NAD(P)-dependent oxidoreductase [Candidatus Lokiarchaeota archaeon]
MIELKHKNCFITGAASGIGRSFAIALAKEGMNLFITDIDMENLKKTKSEIESLGVRVYANKCDVSSFEDLECSANEFYSKLGSLDLLINNAGIVISGTLLELELEDWKKVLDVNLWSIIHSIKVFLPRMLERKSGHIVNVASAAGIFGSTEPLPYITSKFAVVGISEALFGRLRSYGINVSVIVPSYVRTDIFSNLNLKYPKKLLDAFGKEKLEEIYKSILNEMSGKAMHPDRAVKKYISGIKKNQLYIFDTRVSLTLLALKGKPQEFEEFLINYHKNSNNVSREQFLKFGINVDDYDLYQ